jgi:hypothetical protein
VNVVSDRAELAAGVLLADDLAPNPSGAIALVTEGLRIRLNPTSVWQSGALSYELRGDAAYGQEVVRWSPPQHVTQVEAGQLETAWSDALPPLDPNAGRYLRLRVDTMQAVRRLRAIGDIDGLTIVPSLDLRNRRQPQSWQWRWPLRVGVIAGGLADDWLATLQQSGQDGHVLDAERFDPTADYDIAIVSTTELSSLTADVVRQLSTASCVIVAGDGSVEDHLTQLDENIAPPIAVAVAGPPEHWSQTLFDQMSRDVPIDAAVEGIVRTLGVDALLAGPRYGMDITASTRWMAAVAPDIPELGHSLDLIAEAGPDAGVGTVFAETNSILAARARGVDPVAIVQPPTVGAPGGFASREWMGFEPEGFNEPETQLGFGEGDKFSEIAEERSKEDVQLVPGEVIEIPTDEPAQPRRLVARVNDGKVPVTTILPPNKELLLRVRIAIPEEGDTTADGPPPTLPDNGRPTVDLEVVVTGDVWKERPQSQMISISREVLTQPSTWARFPFTTPHAGAVVTIEIGVFYQGKPLQAATYVSPVSDVVVSDEKPTLTTIRSGFLGTFPSTVATSTPTLKTFVLSGPDEPTDELRPVDVTLDGTGAELKCRDSDRYVHIEDAKEILEDIEGQLSKVLGDKAAPDSFDDPCARQLLITLAQKGVALRGFLKDLDIGDARSINITVLYNTPVLPLELVYAGPAPTSKAQLCDHGSNPPPPGQACEQASTKRVCPYAFWGLYRSIARTVKWASEGATNRQPWTTKIRASSVLCGASAKADEIITDPLPTDRVRGTAEGLFGRVAFVQRWSDWREKIKSAKPNLLVILGHTMMEPGANLSLYLGQRSVLEDVNLVDRPDYLHADGTRPLVFLIACASAVLRNPYGSFPGAFTREGAGAVVGTLSKINGPHAATATEYLLRAIYDLADTSSSVGDAVQAARRNLIAERKPIGLVLVSHGEMDTRLEK